MEQLGYDIIVVSQNRDKNQAVEWNQSENDGFVSDFIHIADGDRLLYNLFGFARSLSGVWGVESLTFYSGQNPETAHPTQGQDVNQMGGDIVVDHNGRVSLAYYSKTNVDRPSIRQIVQSMQGGGEAGATLACAAGVAAGLGAALIRSSV